MNDNPFIKRVIDTNRELNKNPKEPPILTPMGARVAGIDRVTITRVAPCMTYLVVINDDKEFYVSVTGPLRHRLLQEIQCHNLTPDDVTKFDLKVEDDHRRLPVWKPYLRKPT